MARLTLYYLFVELEICMVVIGDCMNPLTHNSWLASCDVKFSVLLHTARENKSCITFK